MVRFRVFAMYVRTELVHTYIAKRRSSLIYMILVVPKMGTATSTVKERSASRRPLDFIEDFLYIRELAFFAVYVCTSSVRTYIAKTLKRTIYTNPLRH